MRVYIGLIMMITLILASCGDSSNMNKKADYDQTKEMVVDILQTDEGKKTLREIMNEDKMKQQLIMDSDEVKDAITDAMVSEEGKEIWKELFDDPAFATSFMYATKEGQEKLFKHLINDPCFQKKMKKLLQKTDMSEQTLTLIKRQQYREHVEEKIKETINSPLFQEKMMKEAQKSNEKENDDKQKKNNEKQNDENSENEDEAGAQGEGG